MVYPDSNLPPVPDLDDPRPDEEVINEADDVSIQALRRAEHGLNNFLTSITIGPHDPRALAVARTKVQEAFMWAERSIRKPRG